MGTGMGHGHGPSHLQGRADARACDPEPAARSCRRPRPGALGGSLYIWHHVPQHDAAAAKGDAPHRQGPRLGARLRDAAHVPRRRRADGVVRGGPGGRAPRASFTPPRAHRLVHTGTFTPRWTGWEERPVPHSHRLVVTPAALRRRGRVEAEAAGAGASADTRTPEGRHGTTATQTKSIATSHGPDGPDAARARPPVCAHRI